jgi:hypothetical protein
LKVDRTVACAELRNQASGVGHTGLGIECDVRCAPGVTLDDRCRAACDAGLSVDAEVVGSTFAVLDGEGAGIDHVCLVVIRDIARTALNDRCRRRIDIDLGVDPDIAIAALDDQGCCIRTARLDVGARVAVANLKDAGLVLAAKSLRRLCVAGTIRLADLHDGCDRACYTRVAGCTRLSIGSNVVVTKLGNGGGVAKTITHGIQCHIAIAALQNICRVAGSIATDVRCAVVISELANQPNMVGSATYVFAAALPLPP